MIAQLYQHFTASTGLTTDTRNIAVGNLFFALKGATFNANTFAAEAFAAGARYVVVDEIAHADWPKQYGERLILVANVLETLQQLATHHRLQFTCPVLAITGSNGKTTTKELLAAALSKKYKTYFTKGNLNNHIGVPLTLLAIKSDAEFIVIEMGANHIGEIESYCKMVQPTFGLITNVGLAHLEGFGSFEGVVQGKTELYKSIASLGGKLFVSSENKRLLSELTKIGFMRKNVLQYGLDASAVCVGKIVTNTEFLSVEVEGVTIQSNLIGDYNFENVMSAVAVAKYFGVATSDIKSAIETYVPTNNRSQKINIGTNTIILDAYNANPSSLLEALKNLERVETTDSKIAIIGQMMEMGAASRFEHERIAEFALGLNLAQVVFVGHQFSFIKASHAALWFEKTDEVKAWFKKQNMAHSYILIKGSRKNELEKIIQD